MVELEDERGGGRMVKKGTKGGWRMRSSGRRSEAVVKVHVG